MACGPARRGTVEGLGQPCRYLRRSARSERHHGAGVVPGDSRHEGPERHLGLGCRHREQEDVQDHAEGQGGPAHLAAGHANRAKAWTTRDFNSNTDDVHDACFTE